MPGLFFLRRSRRSPGWTRRPWRARRTLKALGPLPGTRSADAQEHEDQESPDEAVVVMVVILRDGELRRSCVIAKQREGDEGHRDEDENDGESVK
jgi:hypothetical protein